MKQKELSARRDRDKGMRSGKISTKEGDYDRIRQNKQMKGC